MKHVDLEIDERLIREGLKMTKLPSVDALVDRALRDLVSREQQKRYVRTRGSWDAQG